MRLLAEDGQLALADLVEDLPRLFVAELVDLVSLQLSEQMEGATREIRAYPEGLQGRDQGVSSEERHEPRQPGGRQHVGLVGERPFDPQRRKVDDRLVVDGLERGAVGLKLGRCVEPPRQRPFRGLLLLAEVLMHRLQHGVVQLELDPHDGSEELPWRDLELPDEAVAFDSHRGVGELLERGRVEDAATHDAHGAGRLKPWNLVGEPHRLDRRRRSREIVSLRSRTTLFISNRSAKSVPQVSRSSNRAVSRPALTAASCSSRPLPTKRKRRTAIVFGCRPSISGFVR